MNTALLSARKRTGTGELRAFVPLVGKPVIAWQIALAMELGCTRIVCLCDAPSPEILELQHSVESKGGEFHAIRTSLQLITLLKSDETLLMLLDGLVVDNGFARAVLANEGTLQKSVLTLEAGSDLTEENPAEFERIDATRCWAGALTMRAAHAQKLADLPPDGDTVSLLLRIALQMRTDTTPLILDERPTTDWVLATDQEAVADRQNIVIDHAVPKHSWSGPTLALASKLVGISAATGINKGPIICNFAETALLLLSVGLIAYGYASYGLGTAAFAAAIGAFGEVAQRTNIALFGPRPSFNIFKYIKALRELLVIICLAMAVTVEPMALKTLPVFVIGMVWLAAKNSPLHLAPFWNDRALHLASLAICTVYGLLSEGLVLLGLLALAQSIWRHFFAED